MKQKFNILKYKKIIMLALIVSERSLGKPYFEPFEPFNKKAQKNA